MAASDTLEPGGIVRAAGGVLWRSTGRGAVEVALIHRPRYGDWSLPKGKLRRREHPLVTACREVAEETGVRAAAGRRLDVAHYHAGASHKAVEYWAMRGPDAPFRPTAEVDQLAWLPLTAARQRLDYQQDGYALDALEAAGPDPAGSAVLLVRNARAVPARRHEGAGADRPLGNAGRSQAQTLGRVLPAFGPGRLVSAAAARFASTLEPLSRTLGLRVEVEAAFGEEEYAARPRQGLEAILAAARAGSTAAVCAPGSVIRHLLATLADEDGLVLGGLPARKASVWALFFAAGKLTAADYYPHLNGPSR